MKIAFLGTPDFALPSLKMLHERGDDVVVFTQPDKPVGRKAVMTPPPVKKAALEYGMKVYQFDKIKSEEGVAALKAEAPELMVTAAFGQILSRENLAVPKYGCINVHGSLLPKYRGAAPIQWAVINGEKITGVTTMLTDVGLDTGDILLNKETEIGENETAAITVALAFATFENVCYLIQNGADRFSFIFFRGFGTGAMHVLCGLIVGGGLAYTWQRTWLKIAGTCGLLGAAITLHAIYNLLIAYGGAAQYVAYALPVLLVAAGKLSAFRLGQRK